jgi:hypothetical protein
MNAPTPSASTHPATSNAIGGPGGTAFDPSPVTSRACSPWLAGAIRPAVQIGAARERQICCAPRWQTAYVPGVEEHDADTDERQAVMFQARLAEQDATLPGYREA